MKEQRRSWTSIILGFLPPLLSLVLAVVAYFAAFAGTVLMPDSSSLRTDTWGVYRPLFTLLRYTLYLIVFGWWYFSLFILPETKEGFLAPFKKSVKAIGRRRNILLYIPIGFIFVLAAGIILTALRKHFPESTMFLFDFPVRKSALLYIGIFILAPISEEILFRGLVQSYLSESIGDIPAVILQAVLFSFFHFSTNQYGYSFILGIALGLLTLKRKGLFPAIYMHAIVNISHYIVFIILNLWIAFAF